MPKISALTADTAPTSDDLVPIVNDPSGTPGTRKVTLANLAASAPFAAVYAPALGVANKSTYYFAPKAATITAGAIAADRGNFVALEIADSVTLDRIAIEVTATAASSVIRLGLYADDDGLPGALIVDAGTVDSAASTGVKEITISQAVTPGVVWLCAAAQGGAPSVRLANGGTSGVFGHATAATISANLASCYQQTAVSGALPASAAINLTQVNHPRVLVRVA